MTAKCKTSATDRNFKHLRHDLVFDIKKNRQKDFIKDFEENSNWLSKPFLDRNITVSTLWKKLTWCTYNNERKISNETATAY